MAGSALLSRIADLDAMLQMGFTITMADVTVEEFAGLRMLREARASAQEREVQFDEARAKAQTGKGGF